MDSQVVQPFYPNANVSWFLVLLCDFYFIHEVKAYLFKKIIATQFLMFFDCLHAPLDSIVCRHAKTRHFLNRPLTRGGERNVER
jgi:hypothetical protein